LCFLLLQVFGFNCWSSSPSILFCSITSFSLIFVYICSTSIGFWCCRVATCVHFYFLALQLNCFSFLSSYCISSNLFVFHFKSLRSYVSFSFQNPHNLFLMLFDSWQTWSHSCCVNGPIFLSHFANAWMFIIVLWKWIKLTLSISIPFTKGKTYFYILMYYVVIH
jgi:hypothetical protein